MTKLSKEAKALIRPEWDKMQEFIKETDKVITDDVITQALKARKERLISEGYTV